MTLNSKMATKMTMTLLKMTMRETKMIMIMIMMKMTLMTRTRGRMTRQLQSSQYMVMEGRILKNMMTTSELILMLLFFCVDVMLCFFYVFSVFCVVLPSHY